MATVDLHPDFRELLRALNRKGVEYLVIGGYAVIHHGYRRTTTDIELWISVSPVNASRMSEVLQEWGGFSSTDVPTTLFDEIGKMVSFGREPVAVDILTRPAAVSFQDCYPRRATANWDDVDVPLIALEDLLRNKAASGRAKDVAELEYLPLA